MGKNVSSRKKFLQVFIVLLVGELMINPGDHCVCLFIRSSKIKILVSSPYSEGFLSYRRLFTYIVVTKKFTTHK